LSPYEHFFVALIAVLSKLHNWHEQAKVQFQLIFIKLSYVAFCLQERVYLRSQIAHRAQNLCIINQSDLAVDKCKVTLKLFIDLRQHYHPLRPLGCLRAIFVEFPV